MQTLARVAIALLIPARPAAAAENAVPNFGMDSRIGWIAGVPGSNEPIGDDLLPPPAGPGPIVSDKDHPLYRQHLYREHRNTADIPSC
jgi:hypothetical protein